MRTTGNTPIFQVPKRKKPSARVWVTFLLCALVPPLGLIAVWRTLRCPIRGKVLLSLVALLSLTLMLTTYIGHQLNRGILVPQQAAGQFAENDFMAPGAAVATRAPAAAQETPAPAAPQATPAPANPFG